jgi:hypothetical protein
MCFVHNRSRFNTFSLLSLCQVPVTVQVTFNIGVPISTSHMFNGWVMRLGNQFKKIVPVGAAAFYWTLWISRNDMVFDNSPIKTSAWGDSL